MNVIVPVVRCPTCNTPWVLRWSLRMMTPGPPEYLFQRDCKHKSTPTSTSLALDEVETAKLSGCLPDEAA